MADLTKLNAAVSTLSTDVDALIAASGGTGAQQAIDQTTAAVVAIDQKVKDETAALNPPA